MSSTKVVKVPLDNRPSRVVPDPTCDLFVVTATADATIHSRIFATHELYLLPCFASSFLVPRGVLVPAC